MGEGLATMNRYDESHVIKAYFLVNLCLFIRYSKRQRSNSESRDESFCDWDESDLVDDWDDTDDENECENPTIDPIEFDAPEKIAEIEKVIAEVNVKWVNVPTTYNPRKMVPEFKEPKISFEAEMVDEFNEMDVFKKLFPRSLIMWIVQCTNERLEILAEKKRQNSQTNELQ